MQRIKLILLSLIPLLVGIILNYLMLELSVYGSRITISSLFFFIIWFYYGYKSNALSLPLIETVILGNLSGFVSIILIIGQFIAIGHFSSGYVGQFPQTFFLPTVAIAARLDFMNIFNNSFSILLFGFILMIIVFVIGNRVAENR